MKKTLACLLSLSIILLSPGLASYAAAGQVSSAGGAKFAAPLAMPAALELSAPSSLRSLNLQTPSVPLGLPSVSVVAPSAVAAAVSQAAAEPAHAAAPGLRELVSHRAELSLSAAQAATMSGVQAREAGDGIMDRFLGIKAAARAATAVEAMPLMGSLFGALAPAGSLRGSAAHQPPAPLGARSATSGQGEGPRLGAQLLGALTTVGRVAGSGALVLGLQAAGAALAPAVFGLAPIAAVWAVSSGVLLLPAALYARMRLSLRDSPRLTRVKWLLDGAIGAYLGAAAVAFPALSAALAAPSALLGGAALAEIPAALVGGAKLIGVAPVLGMMALPAMTTIAFFLGPIITAAETGRPFSVPGSLQKIRFPSFNWVMIGVVFALTTGFPAVQANMAFMLWMFAGNAGMPTWDKKAPILKNLIGLVSNFNVLYLGLLAFTAATSFASPLTFLVLAFAPERAAAWTEGLLGALLPASAAAPSTQPVPQPQAPPTERFQKQWPAFHHWAKTFALLGTMAALAFGMGYWVFGIPSLLNNLVIASVLAALPLFLAKRLVKAVMQLKPATPKSDPEFYEIMNELRDEINAELVKKGKQPIPLPELAVSSTEIPNAAATGLSPYQSLVFVTKGIKDMLLVPENLRGGLERLLAGFKADSDEYQVFRMGLVGVIPGVTQTSSPQEASQAILRAGAAELRILGKRLLRGVLAHEFSHVMDRHMITGTIGAAISSGVALAGDHLMWNVTHPKQAAARLKDRMLGRPLKAAEDASETRALAGPLPVLLPVFAALWARTVLQITQMAGSRNNEAQADEDGAKLSKDPAALALALGLLTTWRPQRFAVSELPRLAAVSHMMTVNPLQQLEEAGVLPKSDAMPVGRADNFMLELFITHPDTLWRIRTLKIMAEALSQDRNPPEGPPPPAGGGGSLAPPLASLAPQPRNAPAESRGVSLAGRVLGMVRGAWNSLYVVLPDPALNREFWKYTLGQALVAVGVNFHYSALTKLLAPRPEDSRRVTDNRAINDGSEILSSLVTGPLVDTLPLQSTLAWTHLGRGLLMAAVPVLFFHGFHFIAAFHVIVFVAGFLQSAGLTAGSVAFNRILAGQEAHYNRANAVVTAVTSVIGILAPLAAGVFIVAMDARYGFLAGNALSYAVYGVLLIAAAVLYRTLRLPRGPPRQAAVGAPKPQGFGARLRELIEGFRLLWRSRFLRFYLLFSTFSCMMGNPIIFSALPHYLSDVLVLSKTQQDSAFSLYLAASSLGAAISSLAMIFMKDSRSEPAPAPGDLSLLEKQGRWSSILHGVGWLLYLGVFFSHSLPASIAFMVGVMLLSGFAVNIWSSLVQKVIADEAPQDMGKIYAALLFYQLSFSIVGSLLFGWIIMHVPTLLALQITAGVIILMAGLDILEPLLIFPIKRALGLGPLPNAK